MGDGKRVKSLNERIEKKILIARLQSSGSNIHVYTQKHYVFPVFRGVEFGFYLGNHKYMNFCKENVLQCSGTIFQKGCTSNDKLDFFKASLIVFFPWVFLSLA